MFIVTFVLKYYIVTTKTIWGRGDLKSYTELIG